MLFRAVCLTRASRADAWRRAQPGAAQGMAGSEELAPGAAFFRHPLVARGRHSDGRKEGGRRAAQQGLAGSQPRRRPL